MTTPDALAQRQAWLELPDGSLHSLGQECRIGRAKDANDLVIDERAVSSRHVNIVRGANGYSLIDQHSTNGTYLNGLLLRKGIELKDGDEIRLATVLTLRFRCTREFQAAAGPVAYDETTAQVSRVEARDCWLMLADVVGYSGLIASLGSEGALMQLQKWITDVRPLIEGNGGAINSYVGDAILAYWPSRMRKEEQVLAALQALEQYRPKSATVFRIVLHHGIVLFNRSSLGEEVSGQEVNFIFRSEKIAKRFSSYAMLSEPAITSLHLEGKCDYLGTSGVDGIAGQFSFYQQRAEQADREGSEARRVLLIEEAKGNADSFAALLRNDPKFDVDERAQHGASARRLATKNRPHAVVIELEQRTGEVIAVVRDLLAGDARIAIMILAASADADFVGRALHAGVRGFAFKSDSAESQLQTLQAVLEGGLFLAPNAALPFLRQLSGETQPGTLSLSAQDVHVLRGLARGHPLQAISIAFGLVEPALEDLQRRLATKLHLASPADLLRAANALTIDAVV